MPILDWGPISRIRRNHALEHATLQILAARGPRLRLAGYSDAGGFWVLGEVSTDALAAAAQEALLRLEGGEHALAIHPNCGTNFATAGALAGTLAWLAMLGAGDNWKKRLERLPMLMSLATLALILAQPLGPLVQARVTTAANPRGMRLLDVSRQPGSAALHRVRTAG